MLHLLLNSVKFSVLLDTFELCNHHYLSDLFLNTVTIGAKITESGKLHFYTLQLSPMDLIIYGVLWLILAKR